MRPLSEFKNPHETLIKGLDRIKNFHHWVSAGTALGLYRDKDLIPNDTDIDVEIMLPYDFILNDFKDPEGFTLLKAETHEGRPMQRAYTDKANEVIFDIYFMYTGVKEGMVFNLNDFGEMCLPVKFFEKPEMIKTKYGELPFPSPIEEYLLYRYGQNWKIPMEKKGLFNHDF